MIKTFCDKCEKDISTVCSGYDEYRFVLTAQAIPNTSETSFGYVPEPPPHGVFCSLKCLKEYLKDL